MKTGDQDLFGGPPKLAAKPPRASKPATRSKFSWFFALRPNEADAQRIYQTAGALLASNGVTGSRITPDRLHITLEWIGDDLTDEAVQRACDAADSIHHAPLQACFIAVKTFPAPSGPCVLLGAGGLDDVRKLRSGTCPSHEGAGL